MKNRQLSLSDIQKDYISKEEFYQIAHICKETALWLIETGRVSAEIGREAETKRIWIQNCKGRS